MALRCVKRRPRPRARADAANPEVSLRTSSGDLVLSQESRMSLPDWEAALVPVMAKVGKPSN
jgi:hypothetical protein